jgi:GntR family transcriptional regulator
MTDSIFAGWAVEYESGLPVYRQIINRVTAAVTGGTLKNGDQLPTIRALSAHLQVNPNTVAKAYRELELKGVIASERGSGSFIQTSVENAPPAVQQAEQEKKLKLNKLYQHLLAEAAGNGVTESELLDFIKQGKLSTL